MCLYFLGKYFLLPLERKELTDHGVIAPNPGQHYSIAPRLPGTHSWLVLLVTEFCIWSKKELLAKKVEKQFSDHKSKPETL